MGINQTYALDVDKTSKYGKHFNSIDFELNDNTNSAVLQQKKYNEIIAGELIIDNFRFKLNLIELERIAETCMSAKDTFIKKYKLGLYGS